jgi:hypothetical protein
MVLWTGLVLGCFQSGPITSDTASSTHSNHTPEERAAPHDIPLTEAEIDQLRRDTATWSAAIERIQSYRDAIAMETTTGGPAKAHRPLDLLDHLLQWLPEIAQDSNVPKDQWYTIGASAQALRELLEKVHTNIDEGKDPGYRALADRIDAAVGALASIKTDNSIEVNKTD